MSFYDPSSSYRDPGYQQQPDNRPSFFSIDNRAGYDSTPWHGQEDNPAFAQRAAQRAAMTQAAQPMQESEPPPSMADLLTRQFSQVDPSRFNEWATGAGTSGNEERLLANDQFRRLLPAQQAKLFQESQGHTMQEYGQLQRVRAARRDPATDAWNQQAKALQIPTPLNDGVGGSPAYNPQDRENYNRQAAALNASRPKEFSYADMAQIGAEDKHDREHLEGWTKALGVHPINLEYDPKAETATIPAVMGVNRDTGEPEIKSPARTIKMARVVHDGLAEMASRQGFGMMTIAQREKDQIDRARHAQLEKMDAQHQMSLAARRESTAAPTQPQAPLGTRVRQGVGDFVMGRNQGPAMTALEAAVTPQNWANVLHNMSTNVVNFGSTALGITDQNPFEPFNMVYRGGDDPMNTPSPTQADIDRARAAMAARRAALR